VEKEKKEEKMMKVKRKVKKKRPCCTVCKILWTRKMCLTSE